MILSEQITKQAFMTELKKLFSLSWPLIIAQLTQTLMGVSDTIMAGQYSYTDMAAVAIGFSITMPILMFTQGITLGLSPIISRLQGSKKTNKIANALHQCIWLSLILSLFSLALIFIVAPILGYIEMQVEVRTITIDYVIFILLATPGFALYQSLRNCCEGLSSTRPTMLIMFAGLLINIPANYILINGLFGFPEMGGSGCGLATLIVFYVMAFATLLYMMLAKKLTEYKLFAVINWPNFKQMIAHLKMALPISLTIVFEVSLFGVAAILLGRFGASIVAAHQIALNFSSLMFMLPLSIGMAVAIRIGHCIGEEEALTAKISVYCGLFCAMIIALMTAGVSIFFSYEISALYTDNQAVVLMASNLLFFAALFQLSDGIQVISASALRGYKDTQAMLILSFIAYWLVGLPVGLILGLTDWFFPVMAAKGFWIGFISGLSCAALLMFWRLKIIQRRARHDVGAFA